MARENQKYWHWAVQKKNWRREENAHSKGKVKGAQAEWAQDQITEEDDEGKWPGWKGQEKQRRRHEPVQA